MVDGRSTPADEALLPLDPHLLRADGCFETALVDGAGADHAYVPLRVIALERHLARLCASLERLHLFSTTSDLAQRLREEVARLLFDARDTARDPRDDSSPSPRIEGVLRITVTPGLRLLELRKLPVRVHLRRLGLALHPLTELRHDGLTTRHKTLAWSTHAMATREHPRSRDPLFEGVWLGEGRVLLEGTATNLFVMRGTEVRTPPTTRPILPGTSRARAIDALRELGLEVLEVDIAEDELTRADAVIATSSLLPAAPALSYADAPLRQAPQGFIERLVEHLRR